MIITSIKCDNMYMFKDFNVDFTKHWIIQNTDSRCFLNAIAIGATSSLKLLHKMVSAFQKKSDLRIRLSNN